MGVDKATAHRWANPEAAERGRARSRETQRLRRADPGLLKQDQKRCSDRSKTPAFKKYKQQYDAEYKQTLRGKCLRMLSGSNQAARTHGYLPVSIPLEELMAAVEAAKSCYVCGNSERELHLEHCHTTGAFRGFACVRCNVTIGATERPASCQYVGVYWNKACSKWQAYVAIKKKQTYLGLFDDPYSAAWVRDEYVKQHLGKAFLNNLPDRRREGRAA